MTVSDAVSPDSAATDPVAPERLHLAVALDGAGWHPAAWREPDARPDQLFTAGYWVDLVTEAERGYLDFVTLEDGFGLHPSGRGAGDPTGRPRRDRVRGRLDAVLVAARVAPLTRHIGIVPTVVATHTEPFHASKAIATLDYVSSGRAGVRVRIAPSPEEAALFGRRTLPPLGAPGEPAAATELVEELLAEAGDYVEVMRRLWDSWEDDAEIRDAATGRFVDRDKLHYIDFTGRHFSVRGPSITPRPPQGQPIVAALGHGSGPYQLIGRGADVGFVTPRDDEHAQTVVAEIRAAQARAGRTEETLHVLGDLVVFLDDDASAARARKARMDRLAGGELTSDAPVFVGTPAELASLLHGWRAAGLSGARLRPAALPHDLEQISRALVPLLQRQGVFRTEYRADTLRGLLGLHRPANRYAA